MLCWPLLMMTETQQRNILYKQTYQWHCLSPCLQTQTEWDKLGQEPPRPLQLLASHGILRPRPSIWHLFTVHREHTGSWHAHAIIAVAWKSSCLEVDWKCVAQSEFRWFDCVGTDGWPSVHCGWGHQNGHLSGSAGWALVVTVNVESALG